MYVWTSFGTILGFETKFNSRVLIRPNFRLMLSFLFEDFFHQSEVARPYSWPVKKLEAVLQKI